MFRCLMGFWFIRGHGINGQAGIDQELKPVRGHLSDPCEQGRELLPVFVIGIVRRQRVQIVVYLDRRYLYARQSRL